MWNIIPLDLDIKKKNYSFVEVNQADDVCLNVKFYNNGQPLDLVDGEDTLIVNYANANGTVTGNSSIYKTMSKSDAMIYLPRNCTNSAGTAHMQVTINTNKTYISNKQTTSFPIDIKIHQSVVDGKEVSTNVNSMIDAMNKANIQGQETIKNITETASKYPASSQLYADVEDLKVREYGAENLLLDSGFLSGNIGDGFPWNKNSENTTVKIVDSDNSFSGKRLRITSTTGDAGICQNVTYNRDFKSSYTVSFRVYGTKGTIIKVNLSNVQTIQYTIKAENTWEDVNIVFTSNTNKWNKMLYIVSSGAANFYLQDVALWEGKNAFTYKPNSNECLYDRIRISGQDVLAIAKSGKYAGIGCTNNPFGNNSEWGYYDIDVHSSTYKKIVAKSYNSSLVYENTMNNGTWSGWEQLTTQTQAKNPANITQDSTHRFVSDAEKNKWNMVTGNGPKQQNSYLKLPSGIIIQWGVTNVSVPSKSSATATATFPTPFPNKLLTIQTNVNRNISTMDKTGCENIISNGIMASGIDVDKTKVDIFARDCIGSGSNWTFEVGWIAIGY